MNHYTRIVIKLAISIGLYIAISTLMKYYQPAIGGSIAVSQLEDSYSSSASVKVWKDLKNNWIVGYGVLVAALFFTDVKRVLRKKY